MCKELAPSDDLVLPACRPITPKPAVSPGDTSYGLRVIRTVCTFVRVAQLLARPTAGCPRITLILQKFCQQNVGADEYQAPHCSIVFGHCQLVYI